MRAMDDYRPSWFDRMLEQADRLLRNGYEFLTGEEPYDFDRHVREQELVPIRVVNKPLRPAKRIVHRRFF
jgi:hypothetical protein